MTRLLASWTTAIEKSLYSFKNCLNIVSRHFLQCSENVEAL